MATTLAPTTPVDAASKAPTSIVEMAMPPRTLAEQKAHRFEQAFGQLGFLQNDAHENEERNRHQDGVVHDRPDAVRHQGEDFRSFGQQAKEDRDAAEGESHRKADQQHQQGHGEHDQTGHACLCACWR